MPRISLDMSLKQYIIEVIRRRESTSKSLDMPSISESLEKYGCPNVNYNYVKKVRDEYLAHRKRSIGELRRMFE